MVSSGKTSQFSPVIRPSWAFIVALVAACEGPAVWARPQSIDLPAVDPPLPEQSTIPISATASSGLPVRFASLTPRVCGVDPAGLVTGLASGTCTIAANQPGDANFAPAPRSTIDLVFQLSTENLTFTQVPALAVFDRGTLVAVHTAGDPVSYATDTPEVCFVDGETGLIEALSPGPCRISATAGSLRLDHTFEVASASALTVPGIPSEIAIFAADTPDAVEVRVGATTAGGTPVGGYTVESSPEGITAHGVPPSVLVACPAGCAGYAFRVFARNAMGTSLPSGYVHQRTRYDVSVIFHEPDTRPNDSIFLGSYVLDGTTGAVAGLRGQLSEAMTGGATPYPRDTMTWLPLGHPLSSLPITIDGADGWLVTTFLLPTANTLSATAKFDGTDGWSPGTGMGLHFGYPGDNPGNAYARIFVNRTQPTASPTPAQLARVAYADCAPGGMMGATCMTGTTVAGYGSVGTMGGYPLSQTTTRSSPGLQGEER